jgi:Na+/H+ antiporter NhaC
VNDGVLSLLPPLLAIALAILSRRVVIPLAVAVMCGAVILADKSGGWTTWIASSLSGFVSAVWGSISDYDHRRALVFSLLLGAMVGVLEVGGAMRALVTRLARNIRSRRGGQMLITGLGLGIFFDDYANTLLVGGTMRTTADRFGISRAKLAYLVDSTAAPVAGLSPISTWVVSEISYVAAGLSLAAATDVSAFALFMASMPYRFYAIFALVMVIVIAVSDRDFGPMRTLGVTAGKPDREVVDAITTSSNREVGNLQTAAANANSLPLRSRLLGGPAKWFREPIFDTTDFSSETHPLPQRLAWAAVIPVSACVLTVIASLYWSGRNAVDEQISGFLRIVGVVISNGDSYQALIHGGAVGLLTAMALHRMLGAVPYRRIAWGATRGALQMLPAMVILWFAWALSAQTGEDQLDTGGYLAGRLSEQVSPFFLPTAVFIVAGAVAFSTGTSWGTIAILTPLSIELSLRIGASGVSELADPFGPTCVATVGSVLAGAIFGDHCSPLSDTTILSSRASGCDHLVHVRTQMPYALSVGLITILLGTLPASWGVSPYICLALGTIAIVAMVMCIGKRPDQLQPPTDFLGDDISGT